MSESSSCFTAVLGIHGKDVVGVPTHLRFDLIARVVCHQFGVEVVVVSLFLYSGLVCNLVVQVLPLHDFSVACISRRKTWSSASSVGLA